MSTLTDKVNGTMSWLRLILPILVTVGLFWISDLKADLREVWLMTEQTRSIVSNEIRHHLAEIKKDVAVLATQQHEVTRRVEQLEKRR